MGCDFFFPIFDAFKQNCEKNYLYIKDASKHCFQKINGYLMLLEVLKLDTRKTCSKIYFSMIHFFS